jgi:hypothetical protein
MYDLKLKLLQKKHRENVGIGNTFLNRTLLVIDKWDSIKLKSCTTREIITRVKRQEDRVMNGG